MKSNVEEDIDASLDAADDQLSQVSGGASGYPPSVQPGIPRLGRRPKGWTRAPIGEFLEPVFRPAKLVDDERYQLVTAKRNRGGIVPREVLFGRDIRTKTQFFVEAGDFLISKRQISHGACGIVPQSLKGAVVSNEYVALRPKAGLDLRFLSHLSHSVYFQQTCFHSSIGVHVEKLVFKLEDWLEWEFDIPPLTEQHRIAAVLDAWDLGASHTLSLNLAKRKSYRSAVLSYADQFSGTLVEFGEIADLVTDRVRPSEPMQSVELEDIESETGRLIKTSMISADAGQRFRFAPGDTLFAKLRPYLRKYVLAADEGVCSTEAWVLRPKNIATTPEAVFYSVQTPQFRAAAEVQAGSKMPRADWDLVAAMPVPFPEEKQDQQKWAAYLGAIRKELSTLEDLHIRLIEQKRGLMQRLFSGDALAAKEAAE